MGFEERGREDRILRWRLRLRSIRLLLNMPAPVPASLGEPSSHDHPPSTKIGVVLVAGQLLLLTAIALAGPLAHVRTGAVLGRLLATACLLYAGWTGLSGVRQLGRQLTPLPAPKPGARLITCGIYARVRHPLYASTLALALGWTFWWRSPLALLLTVALAGLLHLKALSEEAWLRRLFPGYAAYARQVPRYLPRFSRH